MQAASCAMGSLRDRVFDCRDLSVATKLIKVYDRYVIPQMVYGSCMLLRAAQQRHLRSILKWDHFITNDEVLVRANSTDIETILIMTRLRWLGYVARMPIWATSQVNPIL